MQVFLRLIEAADSKVCGSPAWIRTTIHGSKGRCPTIRRPGIIQKRTILVYQDAPRPSSKKLVREFLPAFRFPILPLLALSATLPLAAQFTVHLNPKTDQA